MNYAYVLYNKWTYELRVCTVLVLRRTLNIVYLSWGLINNELAIIKIVIEYNYKLRSIKQSSLRSAAIALYSL